MTLSEFLLARIAEDEAEAHSAEGLRVPEMPPVGSWGPLRVLAECEAKRRIVEVRERYSKSHDGGLLDRIVSPSVLEGLDSAMRAIALPFADHPDFDPAWR